MRLEIGGTSLRKASLLASPAEEPFVFSQRAVLDRIARLADALPDRQLVESSK